MLPALTFATAALPPLARAFFLAAVVDVLCAILSCLLAAFFLINAAFAEAFLEMFAALLGFPAAPALAIFLDALRATPATFLSVLLSVFLCALWLRFNMQGDAINLYEQLRQVNPSPQMYYVRFGEQQIIGASPELLFRLRQGEMETYPLAGTTKRGATAEEDTALARALLNDPKEIAEHNMIVDLHRNDIGRVARFGSVKVRSLMDIKRFSHVQHGLCVEYVCI